MSKALSNITKLNDVSTSSGAGLVGYLPSGTGAVATTVQLKLRERYDAINDFGADNTGVTNTTTALLNFYNACIATGIKGRIRPGTYKVTTGVLVFNCNQTNKAFPDIETDGYNSVFFVVDSATATNSPVLTWTNGTALSASTYQWLGGSHGGFTCTDSTGATATSRSVISLQGVKGLQLTGRVVGNGMPGDVVTVPSALFGGSNPDPYAVSDLRYDSIEANNCKGYAINNLNYVGQDSWVGNSVRAIGGGGGIWGSGSGCKYGQLTVANSAGRGYDDGTFASAVGGSPQRNYITIAEIDNVQYPFRFNKTSNTVFLGLRIIHRFNVSPNVSGLYWPRIGIDIAGGASPNCTNLQLQVFHRIEGGGVLANLGTLCTLNSSGNISNLSIDADYADNGAIGVTDSLLFSNNSTSATVYLSRKSHALLDSRDKAISFAIGSASTVMTNSGFAAMAFPSQRFSTYSVPYNTTTSTFTAPRRGLYQVSVAVPITLPAGTQVRLQIAVNATVSCQLVNFASTAANQTYTLVGFVVANAGDAITIQGNQNSGTNNVACNPQQADDVRFVVTEI